MRSKIEIMAGGCGHPEDPRRHVAPPRGLALGEATAQHHGGMHGLVRMVVQTGSTGDSRHFGGVHAGST
jgi:hypothetical protein